MKAISIFNDVLGPVMRGPSSSHTAGSFHIARILRDLLGARPCRARVAFDPRGSYAQVFRQQGVDRGFAMGLLGWPLTDARFFRILDLAAGEGLDLRFDVRPLEHADHPNVVAIELTPAETSDVRPSTGSGRRELVERAGPMSDVGPRTSDFGRHDMRAIARSIGGGSVEITSLDDWPVSLTGETWEVLVEVDRAAMASSVEALTSDGEAVGEIRRLDRGDLRLLHARRNAALPDAARLALARLAANGCVREARPLAFVKRGRPVFDSAAVMIDLAQARNLSLGRLALAHEASLVGIGEDEACAEMRRRLDVMSAAVAAGLDGEPAPGEPGMQLLEPSARGVFDAEAAGQVAIGGLHTRAAARALAAMHVNSRMGVVCAAPTGGSAGVLPGVITTLMECASVGQGFSRADKREAATLALFAAGAIGVIVAARATFAAEVAGCQVEIGAAGAMAAAAVVEAAGGSAAQAADAAAIAFQNTMGSVCDLVQGIVEIPCHTRNAVAASSAFVCADLILGGYRNPIPLDETIDAVLAVGRMLPAELRCTARGGLATTPSAQSLKRRVPGQAPRN
jgi:L-serine dehydratase